MTQSISRSTSARSPESTALRVRSHTREHAERPRAQVAAVDEVASLVKYSSWISSADASAVGQAHLTAAGDVVADLADGPDRVLEPEVANVGTGLDHPQHEVGGADLEQCRGLVHVRVADDHVQPPVPLGVGMRLVAGVDDRPAARRGAGDALPDVLGTLADGVDRTTQFCRTLPAPQMIWRVTRNGIRRWARELRVPADAGSSRGSHRSCPPSRCCS